MADVIVTSVSPVHVTVSGALKGAKGDAGTGVVAGGTAGQVLAKTSDSNYDTSWVDQSAEDTASDKAVIIDDALGVIVYLGRAEPHSATSAAVWQIQKIDTTSGLVKTWADGDAEFNNIWDNRVSLTYS